MKKFVANSMSKQGTGYTPSEREEHYKDISTKLLKKTPVKDITASDLVTQYRKNNEEYGQTWESGHSLAYNLAKRDVISDHNRAIAEMIEEKYPDSEFSKLFKESNKEWKEIMDVESINHFMDEIFEGKINHKKAMRFFEDKRLKQSMKRALGDQGYKDFEQLVKDLTSTETPYKMLKVGQKEGFFEGLGKTAIAFVIHPNVATLKVGWDILSKTYDGLKTLMLDKPQYMVVWNRGIQNLKKGNFAEAEKAFEEVKAASDEQYKEGEVLPKEEPKQLSSPKPKAQEPPIEAKVTPVKSDKPKEAARPQLSHKDEGVKAAVERKEGSTEHKPKQNEKAVESNPGKPTPSPKTSSSPKKAEPKVSSAPKKEKPQNLSKLTDEEWDAMPTEELDRINAENWKEIQRLEKERYKAEVSPNSTASEINSIKRKLKKLEDINYNTGYRSGRRKVLEREAKEKEAKEKAKQPLTEAKVEEVKRQDISKEGLKKQKDYILDKVDSALEGKVSGEKLHIKVPGDGEFDILNNEKSLTTFRDKVEKKWPDKAMRASSRKAKDNAPTQRDYDEAMKGKNKTTEKIKKNLTDFKKNLVKQNPSLKIGIKEDGKDLIVTTFLLPERQRGQGIGTQVLKQITDYADETKKTIYLSPTSLSFKKSDDLRLENFYRKHGFKENRNRQVDGYPKELMVRKPQ